MKKKISILLLLCSMVSVPSVFATKKCDTTDIEKSPVKTIVKKYYPHNLFVGMATQHRLINTLSVEIADREFDYITPAVSVSAMPPCPLLFIIIPLPPNQNQ